MIIGISGKKQSGKTTSGNFILSLVMANTDISQSIDIDDQGRIVVSDLLGDKNYEGIFDTQALHKNDYIIQKVLEKLNPLIRLYSFADILKKEICIKLLGLTYNQCYGSDEDKNTMTDVLDPTLLKPMNARDVMQYVGTDLFRKMRPNVWVDATLNQIQEDKPKIAIITDCRFPNEVDSIKNKGGKIIRLTRDLYNSTHISEKILDQDNYDWSNFDYIIHNEKMNIYDQCIDIQNILKEVITL
jgi:hypothetical protein